MNFPFYISSRYLKAKNSYNIINIISSISIIGICVITAALVIVLSVFNGFEALVSEMYSTFDPDLRITAKKGKSFSIDSCLLNDLHSIDGISNVTNVIEDNALIVNGEEQFIAAIKGVSDEYILDDDIKSIINIGQHEAILHNRAIIGLGVAYNLSIPLNALPYSVEIMVPKRTASNLLNPVNAFNSNKVNIGATFSVQQEIDNKYIILPIDIARKLLDYDNEVTAIEIRIDEKANMKKTQQKVAELLPDSLQVKNHFQIQDALYKLMKSEKIAVYLILSFILLIAAFNLIGTLTMLIIDKERDNTILWSMGADISTIKRIYYIESLLMTAVGAFSGLILGLLTCILQIKFDIVKFAPGTSFIVDAYPVKLLFSDFLIIFITVIVIGTLTALIPISKLKISHNFCRK